MAARIYVKELEKQLQHGRPMYDLECDVNIGDVGFFADDTGDFCSLFNVLLDASHPVHAERGVPRGFQPLVVSRQDWKFKSNYFPVTAMGSKTVTSMDIDVHAESGTALAPGKTGLTFLCSRSNGAVLLLRERGHRVDLQYNRHIQDYISQNVESWYEFALQWYTDEQVGEGRLKLVKGCDKTASWAHAVFKDQRTQGSIYFDGLLVSGKLQGSWTRSTTPFYRELPASDDTDPSPMVIESESPDLSHFPRGSNYTAFVRVFDFKPRLMQKLKRAIGIKVGGNRPTASGSSTEKSHGVTVRDSAAHTSRSLSSPVAPTSSSSYDSLEAYGVRTQQNSIAVTTEYDLGLGQHPLDCVKDYILSYCPEAQLAVTTDDDLYVLFSDGLPDNIAEALQQVQPEVHCNSSRVAMLAVSSLLRQVQDGEAPFLGSQSALSPRYDTNDRDTSSPSSRKFSSIFTSHAEARSTSIFPSTDDGKDTPPDHGPERFRSQILSTLMPATWGDDDGAAEGSSHRASHRMRGKRGPSRVSCAECRRLKLKCDGKVPCSQCTKRGYTALCSDGIQTTGQGHHLFWSTTSELRVKLPDFIERIHQLEDALRVAHGALSHESHPLLTDELVRMKDGIGATEVRMDTASRTPDVLAKVEAEDVRMKDGIDANEVRVHTASGPPEALVKLEAEDDEKVDESPFDRFGSLSISQSGGSKHFGPGATSWWFLHNEEGADADSSAPASLNLPDEILAQTGSFPLALMFPPYNQLADDRLRMLLAFIPAEEDAADLRDSAFANAFFTFRPIPLEEYQTYIHAHIYSAEPYVLGPDSTLTAARLANFFVVLAIGSALLERLPSRNTQAERFHQLARAAIMCARLVEEPTIEGIQALFLMSLYMTLTDTAVQNTSNTRWSMAGLSMRLIQTMGLHCDPDRFSLTGDEAKRRRMLFSELFVYDIGQALMFGRPPGIGPTYYDVQPYMDQRTTPETDFHTWKYKFAVECLSLAHLHAYSVAPPSYVTVLALAARMDAYPIWNPPRTAGSGRESTDRLLNRHFARITKTEVLLNLHRPFFAKAMNENRENPLKSEYGSSVIAAYRCAHQIISCMQYLHSQLEHPANRVWYLWANVFGASVVLGALVLQCPQIPFARDALDQLRLACDLFGRVYAGFSAKKVYDKMIIARDRAEVSWSEYITGSPQLSLGLSGAGDPGDVFSYLGVLTRTIVRGESARSGSAGTGTPSEPSGPVVPPGLVVPLPLSAGAAQWYHPQVIQYLRTLSPVVQARGLDLSQMPQEHSPATSVLYYPSSYDRGGPLQPVTGYSEPQPMYYQQHPPYPTGYTSLAYTYSYSPPGVAPPLTSSTSFDDLSVPYATGHLHYGSALTPEAYGHLGAHVSFAQPPARPGSASSSTGKEWN